MRREVEVDMTEWSAVQLGRRCPVFEKHKRVVVVFTIQSVPHRLSCTDLHPLH